jgi:preprotein translocase subunit YajC
MPQRKKQKEHQLKLNAMKKGDKVISAGGIHGIIEHVDEKTVIVKVADNTKIKFQKSSISVVESA